MNKKQMLQQQFAQLKELELQLMMKKCFDDPGIFLFGYPIQRYQPGPSKGLIWTIDEHDETGNPFKMLPNKEYLWYVAKRWFEEKKVIVPKSRQILITWLMCSLHLWLFIFKKGQNIIFQSKKEKDADDILTRAKFIYNNVPPALRECAPVKRMAYCRLEGTDKGYNAHNRMRAVPQGADVLRSQTISALFSDETAFQDQAEDGYTACKPTIDGGGRFTAVSSANGKNFFYKLVTGKFDGEPE